jgi:hypothetical protein
MRPSPIDWCEVNYQHSPYIAEYVNTVSNLIYVVGGAFCYERSSRPLLKVMSVCMMLTGVASALFHATLLWQTQKLDEAFETMMMIAALHTVYHTGKDISEWAIHSLFAVSGIYRTDQLFCEVHLFIVTVALIRKLLHLKQAYAKLWWKVVFAIGFAALGFACWLADRLACEYVQPYYLHAFWHVFTGIGLIFTWHILHWESTHRKKRY